MRMPTSRGSQVHFRGPTSSQQYNAQEDEKYLELVELYKQSNENIQQLKQMNHIVTAENLAMNSYIGMLEDRVTTLEKQLQALQGSSWYNGEYFKTAFVEDMHLTFPNPIQEEATKAPRCHINLPYRYTTPPVVHQIPKTHMLDEKNNKIVIPKELKISVSQNHAGGSIEENNVREAFDGDHTTCWQRRVSYDPSLAPAEEKAILEIELPLQLVHNLQVNTIQIHPHPQRGVQVEKIEIYYKNTWTDLQDLQWFEQEDLGAINSVEFAPRKIWFFPNRPVQRVRITLTQRNALLIQGKKVFILGAQEIGIYLTTFETSGGIVLTPFDMEGLYHIESVDHIFLNRNTFSYDKHMDHLLENQLYEYEILEELLDGTLQVIPHSQWAGQTAKRIWVKTKLKPDPYNQVNPCLHAVRLNFSAG